MPAIISQSGTWTTLSTPTTGQARTDANDPKLLNFASSDAAARGYAGPYNASTNIPDEIVQFVQLVANAYSISFWPAAVLVRTWLSGLVNGGAPRSFPNP
jgi:hypothetical protein